MSADAPSPPTDHDLLYRMAHYESKTRAAIRAAIAAWLLRKRSVEPVSQTPLSPLTLANWLCEKRAGARVLGWSAVEPLNSPGGS